MSERLEDIARFYNDILLHLDITPISQNYDSLLDAKVVHDLGLSGDDFSEFYGEIKARRHTNVLIPKEFIPAELSSDSYVVAMARSWISRKSPNALKYYRSKIKCSPLTVMQLHSMLFYPHRSML